MWDYPRPPRLEHSDDEIRIEHGGVVLAATHNAWRVLETSQAPAYYLPREDVSLEYFRSTTKRTMCEWKGLATYFDVVVGDTVAPGAAWTYASPLAAFAQIGNHIAFYPQLVDVCSVGGEVVRSNEGSFYGGWVTSKVVGPFKGAPGTVAW